MTPPIEQDPNDVANVFQPVEYRKDWFLARIGKVVFRNKTTCDCPVCEQVYDKGLEIIDKLHAIYLSDVEADYTAEGSLLRYFDTKKEAIEFEKQKAPTD